MNNFLNPRILEFLLYLYFSIVLSHVMILLWLLSNRTFFYKHPSLIEERKKYLFKSS